MYDRRVRSVALLVVAATLLVDGGVDVTVEQTRADRARLRSVRAQRGILDPDVTLYAHFDCHAAVPCR